MPRAHTGTIVLITTVCLRIRPIIIMITITITITMLTIIIPITITMTAQDYRMLKGITMMMIVLLVKACIESSHDTSFVLFLFLDYYGGYLVSTTLTTITCIFSFLSTDHEAMFREGLPHSRNYQIHDRFHVPPPFLFLL